MVETIVLHARGAQPEGALPPAPVPASAGVAQLEPAGAPTVRAQQRPEPGAALNGAAALERLGGHAPLYQHALRSFRGEMDMLMPRLAEAAAAGDAAKAAGTLHLVRGLAAMIGAERLAASALAAESELMPEVDQMPSWGKVVQVSGEVSAACALADAAAAEFGRDRTAHN